MLNLGLLKLFFIPFFLTIMIPSYNHESAPQKVQYDNFK